MRIAFLFGLWLSAASVAGQNKADTLIAKSEIKAMMAQKEDTVKTTRFFIQNWQAAGDHRRIIADTVVNITTANQVVNISRFGFTNLASMNVQCTLFNNTSSAAAGLIHNIKSYTTTSLAVNVFSIAAALGTLFPTSTTGILLHVRIDGW